MIEIHKIHKTKGLPIKIIQWTWFYSLLPKMCGSLLAVGLFVYFCFVLKRSCYVAQANPALMVFLQQSPECECLGYRHALLQRVCEGHRFSILLGRIEGSLFSGTHRKRPAVGSWEAWNNSRCSGHVFPTACPPRLPSLFPSENSASRTTTLSGHRFPLHRVDILPKSVFPWSYPAAWHRPGAQWILGELIQKILPLWRRAKMVALSGSGLQPQPPLA